MLISGAARYMSVEVLSMTGRKWVPEKIVANHGLPVKFTTLNKNFTLNSRSIHGTSTILIFITCACLSKA